MWADIAARAANNNAVPPDLSLMTKARHDGGAAARDGVVDARAGGQHDHRHPDIGLTVDQLHPDDIDDAIHSSAPSLLAVL